MGTVISESLPSTSSHSHVSTSSCKVSPHSPPEDPSSTEPLPSQSSPNRCSMPRKLTSKCSTSRTRTPLTSSSGSPTTSSPPSAISHQRVSRCPLPSSETPPPSKRCSRELESNSPPCSEERLSSI